ncbi:hypothetical protein [Pseudonocardia lacus]|uniref:hypothetical protein n=1 Tax=Pseudonocardia lacus TaxID=2835865 RepID=UPI001BDD9EAE|nr:hypothetical protein [Pseudonocardia lacus]
MGFRRAPLGAPLIALAVSALVVAGCGAPEYTYVTNSDDRTYLRVPSTWRALDSKSILESMGVDATGDPEQIGFWLEGYDADTAAPSVAHLFGQRSDAPAVFVGVQDVPLTLRGQISLDVMRDLWRPVSATARQQADQSQMSPFSGFQLVDDEVLTPGDGLRGVHSVYRYRILDGPPQVFDQIVYTNDDASKIYMFYLRCSTECYEQRQQEIAGVVSSFTVRENP